MPITEKPPTRKRKAAIRESNMRMIIEAAEVLFAEKGYNGTSTQEIADRAGLPKANVHYYFQTKERLYHRVLEDILKAWMNDAAIFEQSSDPEEVIRKYITAKMEHSFKRPIGSKLWATEIIQGAPILGKEINKALIEWDNLVTQKIQGWIDTGALRAVTPQSLLNIIWASTQYYADYSYQIKILNKGKALNKAQKLQAIEDVIEIVLNGVLKDRD